MISKPRTWKWDEVFIEVALRAARRVHYEYGVWGIGRQWMMNREKAQLINLGRGIELADERAVCAAITQEFLHSPSLTGLWSDSEGRQADAGYFAIEREEGYEIAPRQKVDIFIRKYERKESEGQSSIVPAKRPPSLIEAKRARLWKLKIDAGTAEPGDLQIQEVREDVAKLRHELAERSEPVFCHVLIWGIYEEDGVQDKPVEFIKQLDDPSVVLHQVRWLPVAWTTPTAREIEETSISTPKVNKFFWIALAQVYPEGTMTA